MSRLEVLKSKWFLRLNDDRNPLSKRSPGTGLKDWADGNKVEVLIDGAALMEHFYNCVREMIQFMEENENTPNAPQLWMANFNLTNVELLGPKQGGRIHNLILTAAQKGVKVYFLHAGYLSQRLTYFWKPWKTKLKKFIIMLNKEKSGHASSDSRNPLKGVHHQKFYVCLWPDTKNWTAVVSSADFNDDFWDTPDHIGVKNPTHELSVVIRGPAVREIALTFAERWNDRANINRTDPQITVSIPIDFLNAPIPIHNKGTHSVQVLRTYPIQIKKRDSAGLTPISIGYSWSHKGEFTIWGAYLQAIKNAKRYIYIEDQYFNSFICPPTIKFPIELLRDIDLVSQLGEALKRKVDVIILVTGKHTDIWVSRNIIKHQKYLSINYLYNIYNNALSNSRGVGCLIIRTLTVNEEPVIVHPKLLIVDDEFVLVGNANIGARSMTYDSEIHLGIVDEKGILAREMRLEIWKEHLQLTEEECDKRNQDSIINRLRDPQKGISIFSSDKGPGTRRLRPFSTKLLKNPPDRGFEKYLMKKFAQPYAGPNWNKWKE